MGASVAKPAGTPAYEPFAPQNAWIPILSRPEDTQAGARKAVRTTKGMEPPGEGAMRVAGTERSRHTQALPRAACCGVAWPTLLYACVAKNGNGTHLYCYPATKSNLLVLEEPVPGICAELLYLQPFESVLSWCSKAYSAVVSAAVETAEMK